MSEGEGTRAEREREREAKTEGVLKQNITLQCSNNKLQIAVDKKNKINSE